MPVSRPLTDEEEAELTARFAAALELIPVQGDDADFLIAGLNIVVEAVRAGRPVPRPRDELAADLGVLWGDELCRVAGWSWCYMHLESGLEGAAVCPADHSLVVLPVHFIHRALTDESRQPLGLFRQLTDGSLTAPPSSYLLLG
jgi:hypothetical protein